MRTCRFNRNAWSSYVSTNSLVCSGCSSTVTLVCAFWCAGSPTDLHVGPPQRVLGPHDVLDAFHLLLVAAPVLHGALLGLFQCTLQGLNPLSRRPKTCSVSGTFSPRDRFSSASSFWMVSFRVLFFSFSFSYFLFHCSAVSSRFTDAVFLMVLALEACRRCPNVQVTRIPPSTPTS
uniref:Transmembrane protein n=1 Tax=Paramormyrops kingsleyae TaxID=1676925 RepID=A0A3B3REV4_9TELE